jgi:hypothetical protein
MATLCAPAGTGAGNGSSLGAHTLRRLGLTRATDLEGGFQAWLDHRRGDDA